MATEYHYFDSTILARNHLHGVGAAGRVTDAVIISSEVVRIELALVIERRRAAGAIDAGTARTLRAQAPIFLAPLHLFPLGSEMLERAESPFAVAVNALDAIHVGTAEVVARDADGTLVFWTLDPRRASAATARGLTVRGGSGDA